MFTGTEIQNFYDHVKRLGLKFPVAAIAKATGYSKGNVSDYLSKKAEPSENFIKAVYEKFPLNSSKVPLETVSPGNNNDFPDSMASVELLKAITTVVESNKGLVDSNKAVTDTNRVIADTNAILAQKLVQQEATGNDQPGIPADALATIMALREQVIEITSALNKISPHEAEAVLGIKAVAAMKRLGKMDTAADGGKKRSVPSRKG